MEDPITLPDPETAFETIESQFQFKSDIKNQQSSEAKKLKRYCAFLLFYFGQAEEKFRIFDVLRPDLSITMDMDDYDLRMVIWWWAYLDTIVHTSNLYDKPMGSNEPASLFYLNAKISAWSTKLGVNDVPELPIKEDDSKLRSLLDLRDKMVIHVEPKYYFKVMNDLSQKEDFFDYLINDVALKYLELVYSVFFDNPPQFNPEEERVRRLQELVAGFGKS